MVPIILSGAMMAGWFVMWAPGLFESLDPMITGAILLADLAAIAAIWFLWAMGKLPGQR